MHYRWVRLAPPALAALVAGRLEEARELTGAPLTAYLLDEAWLWRIRLDQLEREPEAAGWIARAAWCQDGPDAGEVVGHIGFHGPPDRDGRVEVAYSVDPAFRRRGHARAMLTQVLAEVDALPEVRVVRASISPDNTGSLATIRRLDFVEVGEQWDEEDGPETLYERLRPLDPAPRPDGTIDTWGSRGEERDRED